MIRVAHNYYAHFILHYLESIRF